MAIFSEMWRESHRIVRPVASTVLAVAATLLVIPAIVANWARANVYDEESFSDHAVQALEDPAVRQALVREIVEELIGVGPPESISIRPLIELVTATVVDSLTFREIYRDAVGDLHNELFARGNDSDPIGLTLLDALIVITAFIQQAYPETAQQLPPDLTSSFIELRQRDWAVDVVTLGEDIDWFAFLLPIAVVGLYGAAVWSSPDRRRTIAAIGFGWVAVAAILAVSRDFGRDLVLDQVAFADRAVSEAVWDAYTESLLGWATLVGAVGLATSIAATVAHGRVNVNAQMTQAWRAISYTPTSQLAKILRALAFVVIGLLMIREAKQVFEFAVLLAAAYVVYYGVSELIVLASGPQKSRAPATERPWRSRWIGRMALRVGSLGALAAAAFGGVFITCQALDTAEGDVQVGPTVKTCNGSEELCDKRLDEVVFLGTHNSMAAASEPGWYMAEHYSGIGSQLESGVRVLLIDTWYGYETGNGVRTEDRDFAESKLPPGEYRDEVVAAFRRLSGTIEPVSADDPRGTYLCHAFCELGATSLAQSLRVINTFVEANPGEVLFLFIQDQITPEDTAKAFIASGLVKHVWQPEEGQPMPTLREMIEADERVVVLADNNAGAVDWYFQASDFVQDTPYQFQTIDDFSCEPFRGRSENPIFVMNHWLGTAFPSPRSAEQVNSFETISNRVRECERERGRMVNIIVVDWVEVGDALQVVNTLNGISVPVADDGSGGNGATG